MIKPLSTSIRSKLPSASGRVFSQEQILPEQFTPFDEQQQQEGPDPQQQQQQQQQVPPGQQQQQQAPADPFANVDLDMLPAEARDAIVKTRTDLQRLQSEAEAGRKFQSEHDKVKAERDRLLAEVNQRQQQQQQPKTETFEDKMREHYRSIGVPENQLDAMIKVNAPVFKMFEEQMQSRFQQNISPIAGLALGQHTTAAFTEATRTDSSGWSQIPQIQQAVWERAQQLAQQGEVVTVPTLQNLGKIFFVDYMANNGGFQNLQQQQQAPYVPNMNHLPPTNGNGNQFQSNPSFSFPGAGHAPTLPVNRQQASALDPETQAAVLAVTGKWPTKGQFTGKR